MWLRQLFILLPLLKTKMHWRLKLESMYTPYFLESWFLIANFHSTDLDETLGYCKTCHDDTQTRLLAVQGKLMSRELVAKGRKFMPLVAKKLLIYHVPRYGKINPVLADPAKFSIFHLLLFCSNFTRRLSNVSLRNLSVWPKGVTWWVYLIVL